jgi:hypothetical protein
VPQDTAYGGGEQWAVCDGWGDTHTHTHTHTHLEVTYNLGDPNEPLENLADIGHFIVHQAHDQHLPLERKGPCRHRRDAIPVEVEHELSVLPPVEHVWAHLCDFVVFERNVRREVKLCQVRDSRQLIVVKKDRLRLAQREAIVVTVTGCVDEEAA